MQGIHVVHFVFFLFMTVACDGTADSPPDTRPLITVTSGTVSASVKVEFAATPAARTQGLMDRSSLAEDSGMFFMFPGNTQGAFWMKDTLVPLDIAYIDESGKVVDIRAGKPLDETLLYPAKPYRFVLEVNQGWFQRHGLGIGAVITPPPNLPTPN